MDQMNPWSELATKDSSSDYTAADSVFSPSSTESVVTTITTIGWWGEYHGYDETNPGAVTAPQIRPDHFVLGWYTDVPATPGDASSFSKPGEKISEVSVPIASAGETFVNTVALQLSAATPPEPPPRQVHIFKYGTNLDTVWEQETGKTYWLKIQAVFTENPTNQWAWLTTPPVDADLNHVAVCSNNGGTTWTKSDPYFDGHPDFGKPLNLAFELIAWQTTSPLFDLKLENAVLPTSGTIVLSANIVVEGTDYKGVPCLPYVAIMAGGKLYFILNGNRITTKMTPYLTAGKGKGKKRYFKLYDNIQDLPIASIPYTGLEKGRYQVLGALLDGKGSLMGDLNEHTLTIK
ncbi:MAG: hypothetical protein NT045_07875 [Candidatus Aureabacteria bacterium]|nr:hypothetical protein [Candidatus Auribacterota bacterium]